ncbi:MAG: transcription repressor NadR [Clostridia bacterium]
MTVNERRKAIVKTLENSDMPISATVLAEKFSVTRQIIVGDIALIRVSGINIEATPRGYLIENKQSDNYVIACNHNAKELKDELYTIVDMGCGVIDVIVEHSVYGQITGSLRIYSRKDADNFVKKMDESKAQPLSAINDNTHLHTLSCPSKERFDELVKELNKKGYLTL